MAKTKVNMEWAVTAIASRLGRQYDPITHREIEYHVKHVRAMLVQQYITKHGHHSAFMQVIKMPLEAIQAHHTWLDDRCNTSNGTQWFKTTMKVPNGFRYGKVPYYSVYHPFTELTRPIVFQHITPEVNVYLSDTKYGRQSFDYVYHVANDYLYIMTSEMDMSHIYIRHSFQDMDELLELIGAENCVNCDLSKDLALPPDKENALIDIVVNKFMQTIPQDSKEIRVDLDEQ